MDDDLERLDQQQKELIQLVTDGFRQSSGHLETILNRIGEIEKEQVTVIVDFKTLKEKVERLHTLLEGDGADGNSLKERVSRIEVRMENTHSEVISNRNKIWQAVGGILGFILTLTISFIVYLLNRD